MLRPLSSLDAQFLAVEDARTHGHICALLTVDPRDRADGPLTIEELHARVARWTGRAPALRRRPATFPLGLTHPYWEEATDVDVRSHVHDIHLCVPGTADQLADLVARIHARPLDRARPLWEMHLVHGVAATRQALLIKAHHAAMDGALGLTLLAALLDHDEPAARRAEPERPAHPGPWELCLHGAREVATQPARAARALPRVIPHLDVMPMTRLLPGAAAVASIARRAAVLTGDAHTAPAVSPSPRTPLNRRISRERSVAFATLPLEAVDRARARSGATINDVAVTLVASALRAWLLRRDCLPDAPLVAMVPRSLRSARGEGDRSNHVASMLVPIPTDEPDAGRRLLRATAALRAAKDHHRRLPETLLQDANDLIPPPVFGPVTRTMVRLGAHERLSPPCNVVISNLPGPPATVRCGGARVEALHPVSAIVDGVALNVTVVSYAGNLHAGVVADRAHVPEPREIAEDLDRALGELTALA